MTATFRISEDDYVAAMKLFARPTFLRRLLLTSFLAVLLLVALSAGRELWPATLGGVVGLVIVVVITTIVAPQMTRRHYRKYKAIQGEFTAELLDTGVCIASEHGDYTLVWENILKWRYDERFVLIYPMPRMFHILPRSVAEQGFDVTELIERLNRHVGPAY